ncbi:MAG: type II secretion system protein [Patescibacteria group bacterium]
MFVYKKKLLYSPSGFTLMELLVSVAIFLIITGLVIVNFRSGRYRDELVGAAEAIQTSLREMQTAYNSGDTVECVTGEKEPPANGFGVEITEIPTIKTFADCGKDTPGVDYQYEDTDVLLKEITISSHITVDITAPNELTLNVVFAPNSEEVRINQDVNFGGDAEILLEHTKSGRQATVTINSISGLIFYE